MPICWIWILSLQGWPMMKRNERRPGGRLGWGVNRSLSLHGRERSGSLAPGGLDGFRVTGRGWIGPDSGGRCGSQIAGCVVERA